MLKNTPSQQLQGLSPERLRRYITTREIPSRCRFLPAEEVHTIFRYGAIVGSVICSFPSLERGMDEARRLIASHEEEQRSFPSGLTIVADSLTAGKGRFRRPWHAPIGGIWLTLVLVNTLLPENARLLPLAAGVACCETMRQFGIDAQVKWVNDVHVQGRKAAGILLETVFGQSSGEEYVLIGAGINVNNRDFPPELDAIAVSMAQILGGELDLEAVACDLLAKFAWYIGLLYRQEECTLAERQPLAAFAGGGLLDRWRQLSDSIGRRVQFGYDVQQQPQFTARVLGLDDDGGLRLLVEDGVEISEYAGEIIYLD